MKGGARKGAGRKPGTANKKTREIADRAVAEGVTPLEIMLTVAREQWEAYQKDKRNPLAARAATDAANAAAPYIHARQSPLDAPIRIGPLAGSLSDQGKTVLAAVSNGSITPSQAATLMQAIASHARIVEVSELEQRIKALEDGASNSSGRKAHG